MSERDWESVLAAHKGVNVTAAWKGSPNPSDGRNIRRVCSCGETIGELPYPKTGTFRLGGEPFDEPHRAHIAAMIRREIGVLA